MICIIIKNVANALLFSNLGKSCSFTKGRFCDKIFLYSTAFSNRFYFLNQCIIIQKEVLLPLKKTTKLWLRLALPLILLTSIGILISYLDARTQNSVLANLYYPAMMEYIFAALLITVGGVFLIELAERDRAKKK